MFSQDLSCLSLNHTHTIGDRREEPPFRFNTFQASSVMDFPVWNNWLVMALFTPILWAMSCLIDVCFVEKGVFRYPSDGPIVSSLFGFFPLVLFVLKVHSWEVMTFSIVWPALLAGMSYFLHLYFVFRALFTLNDASCSEIFNTLTVVFVPFFAYVVLGERLAPIYYLAIILALTGILVLIRYHLSSVHQRMFGLLMMAVLCMSLTMVLQAWAFKQMAYWHGVLLFALGMVLSALIVVASQQRVHTQYILGLCGRYWGMFLFVEFLQLVAILTSQRATQIRPSVSFVAVVECSLPLFVMMLSAVLLQVSRHWRVMNSVMYDALRLQMASTPAKIISSALILCAILMVQLQKT